MQSIIFRLLIVGLLTLFTQVGGVIYLLCLPLFHVIKKFTSGWKKGFAQWSCFVVIYSLFTFLIVPPLAKWQSGRVPMPIWNHPNLKPHNFFYYCFLNHHYVRPTLKSAAENVANVLAKKYPGTVLCYLDANFPFFNGYPLEPHFSHRDGKKLDISLHWIKSKTGQPMFGNPSFYGYGACASPLPGEYDTANHCGNDGNWFRRVETIGAELFYNTNNFELDSERTREMIRLFAEQKTVGKILLEPHLKTRLNLTQYGKIRFQGCKAARHDAHIHVQL